MKLLPKYPKFRKLTVDDKETIEDVLKTFPPYSDYNFLSMYSYNTKKDMLISTLHENLVVRFRDYITDEYCYSFIGLNNVDETVQTVLTFVERIGLEQQLVLIPEIIIQKNPTLYNKYLITEDRDNFDYILSVSELARLSGKKYYDKRNLVNRFKRLYPQYVVKDLDLTRKDVAKDIRTLCRQWAQTTHRDHKSTETEFRAIDRTLAAVDHFTLLGLGVFIDGTLVSFSITDISDDMYATIAFEKGLTAYAGVYAHIVNETAKKLHEKGYSFINYEQDMGIPGLRKAKMLWDPVAYLQKYTIRKLANDR